MNQAALRSAREYGIAVVVEDLGDWGRDELCSEYDPHGPAIRINARAVNALAAHERDAFIATAIAHELYHHREHIGEVARASDRAARERNADAFARAFVEPA